MTTEPVGNRPPAISAPTAPVSGSRRCRLLLAGTLVSVLAMTGCGSSSSDSTAVSAWAGSVCQATADLDHSLHNLGSELTTGLSATQPTLDQAKQQLRQGLDAVASDAQALGHAVSAAPESASAAVQQQQQQLQADEARAAQAVQELQQAATGVTSADSAPQLATQATLAAATWTAAKQAVDEFLHSVQQLATSSAQEIKTAFSQAPSCAQLSSAQPAPSATPTR